MHGSIHLLLIFIHISIDSVFFYFQGGNKRWSVGNLVVGGHIGNVLYFLLFLLSIFHRFVLYVI